MSGARQYRLDGIYQQRQKEFFMQRIKLPGGILSATQACAVGAAADRFARGMLHLTTRGSIELHWLSEPDLSAVARALSSVGLVSRGACGGAVRGVVVEGLSATPELEALARRAQRHFTGNPRFETLPKKFKIGFVSDRATGRHLIQDIGIVPAASADGVARFDVWAAGGLGREPSPGFLLAEALPEERVLPLIEAVLRVYRVHTAPGKRLKHLVRETGREVFRQMVFSDPAAAETLPFAPSLAERLVPTAENPLEVGIFAGELTGGGLAALAGVAERFAGGALRVNADQNVVLYLERESERDEAERALGEAGFGAGARERVRFRVCPGSHECMLGLAATRDVAEAMLTRMGPQAQEKSWAISGCPNCCAQPQLAQVGVVASRLVTGDDGTRAPRFDLYRMGDGPFAAAVARGIALEELLNEVAGI